VGAVYLTVSSFAAADFGAGRRHCAGEVPGADSRGGARVRGRKWHRQRLRTEKLTLVGLRQLKDFSRLLV
jgi:hypothetical protein